MRIIDRYVVKGFLLPFLWCIFVFAVLWVIVDIFSFIDEIVKNHIPFADLASFYFYFFPSIFTQVTPMAGLLSTIFLLSQLNRTSEITAMKASGLNLWRVIAPLLLIGLIASLVIFFVADRIIPTTSRMCQTIRKEKLEKEKSTRHAKVLHNVALYGSGNRIVFAQEFDIEKKELKNLILLDHDEHQNLVGRTDIALGVWTPDGWKFSKVLVARTDNTGSLIGRPVFYAERAIPLEEKPSDFESNELRGEFLSVRDLQRTIRNFTGASTPIVRSLKVDLHHKIAFSFVPLVIILLGVPFAITTTRGGVVVGIGMSLVLGILYYATISIGVALGKAGVLPPFLAAWLGNIIFLTTGLTLIGKRA